MKVVKVVRAEDLSDLRHNTFSTDDLKSQNKSGYRCHERHGIIDDGVRKRARKSKAFA
ncbi:MAG: hypothetical protein IJ147_02685 [Lachnospiraceae bacterium]|nr:hypothetical protein [Lachnospiraceae bacterium]